MHSLVLVERGFLTSFWTEKLIYLRIESYEVLLVYAAIPT